MCDRLPPSPPSPPRREAAGPPAAVREVTRVPALEGPGETRTVCGPEGLRFWHPVFVFSAK